MVEFIWSAVIQPKVKSKPRVKLARFGDGYEQVRADGVNHNLKEYSLQFNYPLDVIEQIDQFLTARGGVESFLFRLKPLAPQVVVRCSTWNRDDGLKSGSISATFKEIP